MLQIKFFVLTIYFSDIFAFTNKYCEICPQHTLCKYRKPGPSSHCVGYDGSALLSEDDRNYILDKINERRNFIAIGNSRSFPTAANMKKLMWSEELATFAQRWVDQCDRFLKPDRQDECRDLDYSEVGQNIASIRGSSSYYNVRSFVEMWFMESLDYIGSVTYYNQSIDHKTNYFTQLIWADTDKVGCGRAKFYVKSVKAIIVDRLVCNFAPKGNIHGNPIYTIGHPATQCESGLERDETFPGLCTRRLKLEGTLLPNRSRISTIFLNVRNLFNNGSARIEIDPVSNNLKQTVKSLKITANYSNENPMQVLNYVNNSYDAVKRSYPFTNEDNMWNDHRQTNSNSANSFGVNVQKREKGHSRVYHGHDLRNEFDYLHPETISQNARKYDYSTTSAVNNADQDYRKHNSVQQCTRKTERTFYESSECGPCKQKINKCTRGLKNCPQNNECQITTQRYEEEYRTKYTSSREFCSCYSSVSDYIPNSNRCAHTASCECVNYNCPTKPCIHMLRTNRDTSDGKLLLQNDFQYYDMLPHMTQQTTSRSILKALDRTFNLNENPHHSHISKYPTGLESERKRRLAEEEKFKPFWQLDGYDNQKQPQLKSMRYTTLLNKKNKKTKQRKQTMKTESITIKYKERTNPIDKRLTEKYLSFDELLHIRKNNVEDLSGRRNYDERQILRESNTSTTASETTTNSPTTEVTPQYTLNTPYIRLRYCTRKLTCTWTAASLTDSAGSIISGGNGNAIGGSRTPPGYVDGCTRTSTCTRDYMNRNKMATLPTEKTSPEPEPGDEEDYCERRSLNRRSDSSFNERSKINIILEKESNLNKSASDSFNNSCICFDKNFRSKRHDNNYNNSKSIYRNLKRKYRNHVKHENTLLSYDDLYNYVVRKIIETWQVTKTSYSHKNCLCNGVNKIFYCNLCVLSLVDCILYFGTERNYFLL